MEEVGQRQGITGTRVEAMETGTFEGSDVETGVTTEQGGRSRSESVVRFAQDVIDSGKVLTRKMSNAAMVAKDSVIDGYNEIIAGLSRMDRDTIRRFAQGLTSCGVKVTGTKADKVLAGVYTVMNLVGMAHVGLSLFAKKFLYGIYCNGVCSNVANWVVFFGVPALIVGMLMILGLVFKGNISSRAAYYNAMVLILALVVVGLMKAAGIV